MKLDRFRRGLEESPVIKIGDYDYFVHPITDGVPRMDLLTLKEVIGAFDEAAGSEFDVILAPEAMGIPLAVALSIEKDIPYSIARKKRYGLEGEVHIDQVTGYSRTDLYINGISKGDRVLVIDDVLSSGGTIRAIVNGLRQIGAEISGVIVAVEKGGCRKALEEELGLEIKALVKIEVAGGKVTIVG